MAAPIDVRYAIPATRGLLAGTFAGGKFAGAPALDALLVEGGLSSDAAAMSALDGAVILTPVVASGDFSDGGLPSWVPAPGETAIINLNSLESVNACPGNACWYSQNHKNMAPWRNWTGGVFAPGFSELGAMLYWGGGHAGGDDCTIYCFDFTARQWSAIGPGNPASDYNSLLDPEFGDYLYNGSYIVPALHTYSYPFYAPPGTPGVGAKGAWVLPALVPYGAAPHQVDLATGVWSRITADAGSLAASPYGGTFVDTKRNRAYFEGLGVEGVNCLDMTEPLPRDISRIGGWYAADMYYPIAIYVEEADQVIIFGTHYGQAQTKAEVWDLSSGTPTKLGVHAFGTVYNGGYPGYGVDWCPQTQAFYLYNGFADAVVHKFKPSSLNFMTATWTITTETFPDPVWDADGADGRQPFTRWKYVPALRCFAWSDGPRVARPNTETGITNSGAMQLWRPAGT